MSAPEQTVERVACAKCGSRSARLYRLRGWGRTCLACARGFEAATGVSLFALFTGYEVLQQTARKEAPSMDRSEAP